MLRDGARTYHVRLINAESGLEEQAAAAGGEGRPTGADRELSKSEGTGLLGSIKSFFTGVFKGSKSKPGVKKAKAGVAAAKGEKRKKLAKKRVSLEVKRRVKLRRKKRYYGLDSMFKKV